VYLNLADLPPVGVMFPESYLNSRGLSWKRMKLFSFISHHWYELTMNCFCIWSLNAYFLYFSTTNCEHTRLGFVTDTESGSGAYLGGLLSSELSDESPPSSLSSRADCGLSDMPVWGSGSWSRSGGWYTDASSTANTWFSGRKSAGTQRPECYSTNQYHLHCCNVQTCFPLIKYTSALYCWCCIFLKYEFK